MKLITKLEARYIISVFLDWAERKGYSRASERSAVFDILVPYLVTMIELFMGQEVGDQFYDDRERDRNTDNAPSGDDWARTAVSHIKNF